MAEENTVAQDRTTQEVSFDLHINILGMCLFVRDEPRKLLHVLMPPVTEHLHVARLYYDRAHETADGVLTNVPRKLKLENRHIDLTRLDTRDPLVIELKERDVFDLERAVDGILLDDSKTGGKVLARLRLGAGGAVNHRKGARWKIGASEQPMTTWVEWKIINVTLRPAEPFFELTLSGMNTDDGMTAERYRLFPKEYPTSPGRLAIQMWVYHSPDDEISGKLTVPPTYKVPKIPPANHEVKHFAAYYGLLNPSEPGPNPVYVSLGEAAAAAIAAAAAANAISATAAALAAVATASAEAAAASSGGRTAAADADAEAAGAAAAAAETVNVAVSKAAMMMGEELTCIMAQSKTNP